MLVAHMEKPTTPKVAANEPHTPAVLNPTYVAELMAIGPGVTWEMETMFKNSC